MATTSYVIALGSNRRSRHGSPEHNVRAALAELEPVAASPIIASAPLGPSHRRYANAVALIETAEDPPELLARLKAVEGRFGRRRGRRWGARVLDLDIALWSGGKFRSRGLTIPHARLASRSFVLQPLAAIAPGWRIGALGIRHLAHRLARRAPRG